MKLLKNILQFLLFLSIGSVILFLVYRSQNTAYMAECALKGIPAADCSLLDKLLNDFKNVRFGWIGLVLLAFLISNISRTFKWLMLFHPMGYQPRFVNGFLANLVCYFANLGLPRMGEVARAGVLAKYEKIPLEKGMGTIVVDRAVDMMCLLVVFGLALLFESEKLLGFISDAQSGEAKEAVGISWKWLILLSLLALGMAFWFFRKRLLKTVFFQKIAKALLGFWEGILTVKKLDRPGLFIFHSLNIWVMFFLMTWLGFQAFAPTEHLDLRAALTVFVFGTLGFVIPSPGGMGTFHALVIAALTLFYGVRGDDAFSAANIIFFTVQIGFNSLLGIIALILLPIINKEKMAGTMQVSPVEELAVVEKETEGK